MIHTFYFCDDYQELYDKENVKKQLQELVDNLQIALGTMKELSDIYNELGVGDYSSIVKDLSSLLTPNSSNSSINNITSTPNYSPNSNNPNARTVTVGDTNITINGTVSDSILDDIEDLIEQKNKEMLNQITKDIK